MKIQKKHFLRIMAILICTFAVNILSIGITKCYSAFNHSKNAQVKANVSTEDQMFNVDITYATPRIVQEGAITRTVYDISKVRVLGEGVNYNPASTIVNPVKIIVSPIQRNEVKPSNINQFVYFQVDGDLKNYILNINPISFSGDIASSYININSRSRQQLPKDSVNNTGVLTIRYLNGFIDKQVNIKFDISELNTRYLDVANKQWYDNKELP